MSTKYSNPTFSVTVFAGTSLERVLSSPLDMSDASPIESALMACLEQAAELESANELELHIATLEERGGKKLTKPQRELVVMSYNLSKGIVEDVKALPQETVKPQVQTTTTTETTKEAPEKPVDEQKPDPVQDALKEQAESTGKDTDSAVANALAELGL